MNESREDLRLKTLDMSGSYHLKLRSLFNSLFSKLLQLVLIHLFYSFGLREAHI